MKIPKVVTAAGVGLLSLATVVALTRPVVFQQPQVIQPMEIETTSEVVYDEASAIPVYALRDTYVYCDTTLTSGTISDISIGDKIIVYGEVTSDNYDKFFITKDGYLRHKDFTYHEDYVFYPDEQTFYAKDGIALLDAPNSEGTEVEFLTLNDEVNVIGYNKDNYYRLSEQTWLYVYADDLMETMYIEPVQDNTPVEQEVYAYTPPTGGSLSPSAGVYAGPSGKETYYNLDMSGVIAIAQSAGISGNYWVRSDGVKMYGDYVICACGFTVRPRGTIIETSLGTGICLDTGGFAENDPYQIDIAVNWP